MNLVDMDVHMSPVSNLRYNHLDGNGENGLFLTLTFLDFPGRI